MTPEEWAEKFRLNMGDDTSGSRRVQPAEWTKELAKIIRQAIIADHSQLQSEINQQLWDKLRDEIMLKSPDSSCYEIAFRIVQSIFFRPSPPESKPGKDAWRNESHEFNDAYDDMTCGDCGRLKNHSFHQLPTESKPEDSLIHFAMVPFTAYCGANKKGQITSRPLKEVNCEDCLALVVVGLSESSRLVLAEREKMAEICKKQIDGLIQDRQRIIADARRMQTEAVFAERETCAEICDKNAKNEEQAASDWNQGAASGSRCIARKIRFRSNPAPESQPEEKPLRCEYVFQQGCQCELWAGHEGRHRALFGPGGSCLAAENLPNPTPFDPECSTCVREVKEEAEARCGRDVYGQYDNYPCVLPIGHAGQCRYQGQLWAESQKEAGEQDAKKEKLYTYKMAASVFNQHSDRIPLLQQIIGEQAETIIKLQEENHVLQEKLTPKWTWRYHDMHAGVEHCNCAGCISVRESPTSRKA